MAFADENVVEDRAKRPVFQYTLHNFVSCKSRNIFCTLNTVVVRPVIIGQNVLKCLLPANQSLFTKNALVYDYHCLCFTLRQKFDNSRSTVGKC